jgi:DNA-binding transcriptional LysR family regulator
MERLTEMMTFASVVEAKSFSAAARALATSKSLVSKQISNLERGLGVRLLNRTTRRMSLTESGAAYYEHCARIAVQINAAEAEVTQMQQEPSGVLRVTMPIAFATRQMAPALASFMQRNPRVELDINATERVIDIVEEGYDLAIRITEKPTPAMVARNIAPVRWVTCAAPAYIEQHGVPATPQALLHHQCLLHQDVPMLSNGWPYKIGNRTIRVPVTGNCRINNAGVLLQLALEGAGIVLSPSYILGPHIKDGSLVQLLPDAVVFPDMALYATYMPTRYLQPKVRAFIDHLVAHFGPLPSWDEF